MLPSEFFALVPEASESVLELPDEDIDTQELAINVVNAIVQSAQVDYEALTGLDTWPAEPQTFAERKQREVFLCFLNAAALRLVKQRTAMNAKKVHNPDVQMNVAFNLDLVRVIGRAERGTMQRARVLWRGKDWVEDLGGLNAGR